MAFDGITLNKIVNELQVLIGGKVNYIYEPDSNNIVMGIYNGATYALNIDTSASNYRINLTSKLKKNPFVAPNFCMLLRKYLINSRITSISMNGLERICYIEFECFNEMNDKVHRTLVIELMGKYSNVVLLNDSNTIIDALKKFDGNGVSRDIMPARKYIIPSSDKHEFNTLDKKAFICLILNSEYKTLEVAIPSMINGICKMFMQSCIDYLKISNTVSNSSLEQVYDYILSCLDSDSSSINHFKNNYSVFAIKTAEPLQANFFLDDFYYQRSEHEEYISYRNSILKVLSATLDKIVKKLDNINSKIESAQNRDFYKQCGELLIANIYRFTTDYSKAKQNPNLILITDDTNSVSLENYYDDNKIVHIQIDPKLSISKNADSYFKKYNKAKNTLLITSSQKIEAERELNYIESIVYSLDNCHSIEDIDEVYNEISENLLFIDVKIKGRNKNKVSSKSDTNMLNNYMKLKIDDFDVCIGKNNKQNDYLTLKVARDNDYWFHTKDIHGSHLILRCNGQMPKLSTIQACAELAAYYSKAKFSSHVPVDYTLVKYVKKPNGSAPGFVIYTNQKTIYVQPKSGVNLDVV